MKVGWIWLCVLLVPMGLIAGEVDEAAFPLYPKILDEEPEGTSPATTEGGVEVLLAHLKDGSFAWVPVTVENGSPLHYSVRVGTSMGKDAQLHVDAGDFPTLARTGMHAESELAGREMITGYAVSLITHNGRPGRLSHEGFMAADEDVLSVLIGDNRLVAKMGLSHRHTARPLFHVWNLILKEIELGNWRRFWDHIPAFTYNGRTVALTASGSKGWQVSIFQDEIQGRYNFSVSTTLSEKERAFLERKYGRLKPDEMADLEKRLTKIGFSEMAPYYIMRYGFYEGHTGYRADPIAIAFVFGLRSLQELEAAFPGRLYEALSDHHLSQGL